MPEGYEIYEKPESAQVFIRKVKPTRIVPMERQLLEVSLRRLAKLDHFIVAVETRSLVVYISDAEPDAALSVMRMIAPMTPSEARSTREFILSRARYEKMMRFTLMDESSRRFSIERWCFLGGIDDWYLLEGDATFAELLEKYVPHLGQESFFELT